MAFIHPMALVATGAALGAYSIYSMKNVLLNGDAEPEQEYNEPGERGFFKKLMKIMQYVQMAQYAYDAAVHYGPSVIEFVNDNIRRSSG